MHKTTYQFIFSPATTALDELVAAELLRRREATAAAIADRLAMTEATIARALDRLVQAGRARCVVEVAQ